jgi:hypothetical protein
VWTKSDQKGEIQRTHGSPWGNPRATQPPPELKHAGDLAPLRIREQSSHRDQKPQVAPALLGMQQYEAQAREDNQRAQFEVLPTVQETIPRPEALRNGHRDEL